MAPRAAMMATMAGALAVLPSAMAGFDPESKSNVAVYWGQNSFGAGDGAQEDLSVYCDNEDIDIIMISFLTDLSPPALNLANTGDSCSTFPGTELLDCPDVGADITSCQEKGKTIILSLGGATYNGGGFSDAESAKASANELWSMFGPEVEGSDVNRPFGSAVVDGFDYDFESPTSNMVPFGVELRRLMDESEGGPYYISAAPQCVYPDEANKEALDGGVDFDFIMIQFYNNYCGINAYVPGAPNQEAFNFKTWDEWASSVSLNPDAKVLLGVPASQAAGGGYTEGEALAQGIQYSATYGSFAGVMLWDASQLYANDGFLEQVTSALA